MKENHVASAEAYYTAMGDKNVAGMGKYLHPDVRFFSPLGDLIGKEAVLEALKKATTLFKALTIRAKFDSGDQALLVYNLDFPAPIGSIPTSSLMTFQAGLIAKIELFYDGRPFDKSLFARESE